MNRTPKPVVTVVHALPGRVRLRLSHVPNNPSEMIAFLREHEGMGSIGYTPRTRSLLIGFHPHAISADEITLRVAFRYALDQGARPVRVLDAPEQVLLQDSAILAGIGVLTALALRWLSPGAQTTSRIAWIAGLGTAWSIGDHGWRELRRRGYFDPEVLALVYLASALVRGNVLPAAVVTWLTTFGRHLLELPSTGVEVQPYAIPSDNGPGPRMSWSSVPTWMRRTAFNGASWVLSTVR